MKKLSILYIVIGLAILLVFTQKVLLPLVYDVVKSDAFLVDNKDPASQYPISNEMTSLAYMHCNNYIKSELGPDATVSFSDKPLKSWTMGNYHYLINSELTMANSKTVGSQKYVCRITFDNGDNQEGVQDMENWSIEGIDGIEGL
jgi:hypothetical protein